MSNFTAKHDSRTHLLGANRFAYPDNHIEIDNRRAWWTGKLDASFGDTPFYVHLSRDRDAVVQSCVARKNYGLVKACRETKLCNLVLREPKTAIAEDLVDTNTTNITYFVRDKTKVMHMQFESIEQIFPKFWDWIGTKGDPAAAMNEWTLRHNAAE